MNHPLANLGKTEKKLLVIGGAIAAAYLVYEAGQGVEQGVENSVSSIAVVGILGAVVFLFI